MDAYLLLIHNNETTPTRDEEWERFFAEARSSGMFEGGSEVGRREILGGPATVPSSAHIVGYMRFETADRRLLLDLLRLHPVVLHGGTVELCELPRS
jgi:hypothetical protein